MFDWLIINLMEDILSFLDSKFDKKRDKKSAKKEK